MQLHVGVSGFGYKEWRGSFYPEKMPAAEMLSYYAERFGAVEINNSFYRMPEASVLRSWAKQAPVDFEFTIKAPRTITHSKRLKDAKQPTAQLLRTVGALKQRRGPILFQLPPNMKKDLPRLQAFLKLVSKKAPCTFEFRHESWFDDEVIQCLRVHGCALCVADTDELPIKKIVATADWGYLRLRKTSYTSRSLATWLGRIRDQNWEHAYVFFKHEDTGTGPKFAQQLLKLADA